MGLTNYEKNFFIYLNVLSAGSNSQSALGSTDSSTVTDTVVFMGVPGATEAGSNVNSTDAGDGTGSDADPGEFKSGDDYLEWRGELTSPFTIRPGRIPSAKIAFGTSAALGFYNPDTDNNACAARAGGVVTNGFYAAEPDVTITLQ